MIDRELPTGPMGYAIEKEDRELLMENGISAAEMLRLATPNMPPEFNASVNPMALFDPLNQGSQGSCQGHSLALIFTICYWLATGRIEMFSRAAAYYRSQRVDNIVGDRGSTLSGGSVVATKLGMCLEAEWPYPQRYNPAEPPGINYRYKLTSSQPTDDYELVFEALDLGLPVQDGIIWDSSVSRTISTQYDGRSGGGHSTVLWCKQDGNYTRINSWGYWDGDGCNQNTPQSLKQQIERRGNTHVIYAPTAMIYPDLTTI